MNKEDFDKILIQQSKLFIEELEALLNRSLKGLHFSAIEGPLKKDLHVDADFIATVPFVGMYTGEFILCMKKDAASQLYPELQSAEEIHEQLGETLNMVAGSRIGDLSKVFEQLTIVTPRFASGHIGYRRLKNVEASIKFAGGEIKAFFYIDRMRLDIAESYRQKSMSLQESVNELVNANSRIKDQQAQLIQSEKMASLGMMAAGVAHEINNPLSFVVSNNNVLNSYVDAMTHLLEKYDNLLKLLQSGKAKEASEFVVNLSEYKKQEDIGFVLNDTKKLLDESRGGLERIRGIVGGLKRFARLEESGVRSVKINEELQNILLLLQNETKHRCRVDLELKSEADIQCLPGELSQVFMNLIMNAFQAMDKSDGIIRIGTEDVGDSVIIEIEDNGMGIPEENFPKLFSPFFTTKPVGEGTGLGLAISYGIIQKHAGKIEVQSELGKGSVFTIRIPMKNQIQVTEGSKLAVTEAPSVRPSESKWPKNGARS